MKISKIICFLSVSGFNCCPIAKEILMRKQSENGKHFQKRSTDEQKCREYIVVNCRVLTRDFNAKYRLKQYEKCVSDCFKKECGSKIQFQHNPWFRKQKIFVRNFSTKCILAADLETKSRRLNPSKNNNINEKHNEKHNNKHFLHCSSNFKREDIFY